jgi:general stress protein 26
VGFCSRDECRYPVATAPGSVTRFPATLDSASHMEEQALMNSITIKLKVGTSTLLLCIVLITPGVFGQQQPPRLSRDTLIATAREIMGATRYCALITLDRKGSAHARTMDPFPPDENLVIWFGTNPKSRKVAEIRRNHRVTLYYFDREGPAYVTISGVARLVNDPKEKARRWKDEWKAFYPDREQGYTLIAVTPQELEIVSEKKGIVGDAVRWTPPTVRFGPGRPGSVHKVRKR